MLVCYRKRLHRVAAQHSPGTKSRLRYNPLFPPPLLHPAPISWGHIRNAIQTIKDVPCVLPVQATWEAEVVTETPHATSPPGQPGSHGREVPARRALCSEQLCREATLSDPIKASLFPLAYLRKKKSQQNKSQYTKTLPG